VDDGGISDRPGNMSDVFHTFFGISGLLLLNYFHDKPDGSTFISIDPTYALPKTTVEKFGLPAQTLRPV
jgi:geranylgeranyl transferase type-2 subunit beta